jgi:hypothetical protein
MVVTGDLDRAVMEILPVDLMMEMARIKDRVRALETMKDLDRAVTEILPVDLMVKMARVLKDRTEALETMADRKTALDREAMEARMGTRDRETTEDHKTVQAPTMGLASRTQALSHKSTCTQRS